jgi:hypothetical protein
MKPTNDFLLSIVTRLAAAQNVALSTLSSKLGGSGKKFALMADGGGLTLVRYNAILAYCATPANWPGGQVPDDLVERLAPWAPGADASAGQELAA